MTGEFEHTLMARLDGDRVRRLTLVIAPSSMAVRSAVVRQWAGREADAVAWAALTAEYNDPPHFLETVIDAVRAVYPPVEAVDPADGLEAALTDLLNALLFVGQPFVLILGNYQVITCAGIHEAMGWVLDYLPPDVHLILISTSEPPIPTLARLRVRRQLLELRLHKQSDDTAGH